MSVQMIQRGFDWARLIFLTMLLGAMVTPMTSAYADSPSNSQPPFDPEQLHRFLGDFEQLRRMMPSPDFPLYRAGVISFVIMLMAFLFTALFLWQKNVEKSGYFANIYHEAIEDIEINRHTVGFKGAWVGGRYADELLYGISHRAVEWSSKDQNRMPTKTSDYHNLCSLAQTLDNLSPKLASNDKRGWMHYQDQVSDEERSLTQSLYRLGQRDGIGTNPFENRRPGGTRPPGLGSSWATSSGSGPGIPVQPQDRTSGTETKEVKEFNDAYGQFNTAYTNFEKSVKAWTDLATTCLYGWYDHDLRTVRQDAKKSADLALKVDISAIQGRGPEFILEFTAIIVIIFAAVILGIGSVLDSNQIGTLLAAIAGYVLGKAASRATPAPNPLSQAEGPPPGGAASGALVQPRARAS